MEQRRRNGSRDLPILGFFYFFDLTTSVLSESTRWAFNSSYTNEKFLCWPEFSNEFGIDAKL